MQLRSSVLGEPKIPRMWFSWSKSAKFNTIVFRVMASGVKTAYFNNRNQNYRSFRFIFAEKGVYLQCFPGNNGLLFNISAKMHPTLHTSTEVTSQGYILSFQNKNTPCQCSLRKILGGFFWVFLDEQRAAKWSSFVKSKKRCTQNLFFLSGCFFAISLQNPWCRKQEV